MSPSPFALALVIEDRSLLSCIHADTASSYYMWMNRRRDKKALESGISKEEQEKVGREMGEANFTDLQNVHFRYTM